MLRPSIVGLLALCLSSVAVGGELVEVPATYRLYDLPVGTVIKPKAEIVLHAGATATNFLHKTGDGYFTVKERTECNFYFTASDSRRRLTAGTTFELQYKELVTLSDYGWADGPCFRDREGRQSEPGAALGVKTLGGFEMYGECIKTSDWVGSGDTQCKFAEAPTVADLNRWFVVLADSELLDDAID